MRRLLFQDINDPLSIDTNSYVVCTSMITMLPIANGPRTADRVRVGDTYRWPDGATRIVGRVEVSNDEGQTWEEVTE